MKQETKFLLQKIVGYQNYLQVFSLWKIFSLNRDKAEKDFLHFARLLPDKGTILDIGANIGLMTVNLARQFPGSVVKAFEPVPFNASVIQRNIELFRLRNVNLFLTALGNKTGLIEMIAPEIKGVKMHGLCHVIDKSIPKESKGDKFVVSLKKLDDIRELFEGLPVTGIKIDVEHFEWAVLEGARNLIKRFKPVIYCELAENENRTKSFRTLRKLGYKPYIVQNNELVSFDSKVHKVLNFIFR